MFSHTPIYQGRGVEITYLEHGNPITAKEFFTRLGDDVFAIDFSRRLASQPFDAGFWESPPYSENTADHAFRCVLINSPELSKNTADPSAFIRKLAGVARDGSGIFANVNNSATLISPQAKPANYGHLMAFLRKASPIQITNLWAAVSKVVLEKSGQQPLWISTSGLGVPWLHVRVDSEPKYYRHLPYITEPKAADE